MKAIHLFLPFLILAGSLAARESGIVTPAPGTPERNAVCDEMRKYLRYSGQVDRNFGPFLFKVEWMAIQGNYCAFEGFPVNPDGSFSDKLPDVVYTTFLKKGDGDDWEVIADLSRTDVPSDEEMREIRRAFPREIPAAIIPEYWRPKLRG
jgi:hypothetical protein